MLLRLPLYCVPKDYTNKCSLEKYRILPHFQCTSFKSCRLHTIMGSSKLTNLSIFLTRKIVVSIKPQYKESKNKIFSEIYFKVLGFLLSLGNLLGVTSIKLDPTSYRLIVSSSPYVRSKCYVVYFAFVVHFLWLLIQVHIKYKFGTILAVSQLLTFLTAELLCLVALNLLTFWPRDVKTAVNLLINYLTNYAGK